jgi:hypothetical protein
MDQSYCGHEAGRTETGLPKDSRARGEKINRDRDASASGAPISPPMLQPIPKAMWHTRGAMWKSCAANRLATAQRG